MCTFQYSSQTRIVELIQLRINDGNILIFEDEISTEQEQCCHEKLQKKQFVTKNVHKKAVKVSKKQK